MYRLLIKNLTSHEAPLQSSDSAESKLEETSTPSSPQPQQKGWFSYVWDTLVVEDEEFV